MQMSVLHPPYKSLQFSTSGAPTFECTGVTLADTGSGRWKCWQLKGPIMRKERIVITSIHG